MPALVNSRVGSLAGTSGLEATTSCPLAAKVIQKGLANPGGGRFYDLELICLEPASFNPDFTFGSRRLNSDYSKREIGV